jgi:hypothetical protein
MNLISGYDTFARSLFGVLQIEEILATADKAGAHFADVRDHFYDRIGSGAQEGLRAMAKHLDGLPRVSQAFPQAESRRLLSDLKVHL